MESVNLAWYPQYASRIQQMDELVMADWKIPEIPAWAAWNDLNERKQRLRLTDREPTWIANYTESGE